MAKKKKAKKKVYRSARTGPSQPPAPAAASSLPPSPVSVPAAAGRPSILPDPTQRRSYVGPDVRRIAILASFCVLAEALLWYAFTALGWGSSIYGLIK